MLQVYFISPGLNGRVPGTRSNKDLVIRTFVIQEDELKWVSGRHFELQFRIEGITNEIQELHYLRRGVIARVFPGIPGAERGDESR
jgi:hypothetical protein